jgi:hypothetical protein
MPLAALDFACSWSAAANSVQSKQSNSRCDGDDTAASPVSDGCSALVVNSASMDCAIVSLTRRRVAVADDAEDEDDTDDKAEGSDCNASHHAPCSASEMIWARDMRPAGDTAKQRQK